METEVCTERQTDRQTDTDYLKKRKQTSVRAGRSDRPFTAAWADSCFWPVWICPRADQNPDYLFPPPNLTTTNQNFLTLLFQPGLCHLGHPSSFPRPPTTTQNLFRLCHYGLNMVIWVTHLPPNTTHKFLDLVICIFGFTIYCFTPQPPPHLLV